MAMFQDFISVFFEIQRRVYQALIVMKKLSYVTTFTCMIPSVSIQ